MAVVTLYDQTDIRTLAISNWQYLVPTVENPTTFSGYYSFNPSYRATFVGAGFTYNPDQTPSGAGMVTHLYETSGHGLSYDVQGISIPVSSLLYWSYYGLTSTAMSTILSGNDTVNGSPFADVLMTYGGDDVISGGGGNDAIDGGAGRDTVVFNSLRLTNKISFSAASHSGTVSGAEGTDTLANVESLQFLDGRLAFDSSDPAAQALRLYSAAFNRAPDASGLGYWADQLVHGVSLNAAASSFASSSEFQTTYGSLSNKGFVDQLYLNVLGRAADAGGESYWVGQLQSGTSRGQVLAGFSQSTENVNRTSSTVQAGLWQEDTGVAAVARLYDATFQRHPDASGMTSWAGAVHSGASLSAIAASFASSTEFQTTYGAVDNRHFVEQLYINTLGRQGETSGIDYWTHSLDGGSSRGDILAGFSESVEHQARTSDFIDHGIWLA